MSVQPCGRPWTAEVSRGRGPPHQSAAAARWVPLPGPPRRCPRDWWQVLQLELRWVKPSRCLLGLQHVMSSSVISRHQT